jgi:Cu/Ag efflux protein CusF
MGVCPNRILFTLCLLGLAFATACSSKPETKRYAMTGAVVAVHSDTSTLTVHNDDVPGFMPPMNMEYKVKDAQLVERVKSGDKIKATLVIEDHNPAQLEDVAVLGK